MLLNQNSKYDLLTAYWFHAIVTSKVVKLETISIKKLNDVI
jgi:hypothetical protein